MGVVVRRHIDIVIIIIFPYSTCTSSFFGNSIPISLFILKCLYIYKEDFAQQYDKCGACSGSPQ